MTPSSDLKKYAVLYVDDEEQSLKYFPKLFGGDLRCLTAPSIAEARLIIEREAATIGVVISDQRMPGGSGVDLLSWLRTEHPQIVRILTTAYSDLDSAISAVNSGAIFRYVVKPWDHREMFGVLARAMEFHLVTRERDALLREKLTVFQQVVVLDRRRSFAALAAGLSQRVRNSLPALRTFLDSVPTSAPLQGNSSDMLATAQRESRKLVALATTVSHSLLQAPRSYAPSLSLPDLLAPAVLEAKKVLGAKATATLPPGLPAINADGDLITTLGRLLVALTLRAEGPTHTLQVDAEVAKLENKPAVRIRVRGGLPQWQQEQLQRVYAAMTVGAQADEHDADLLTAFFIAHHHGGTMSVLTSGPAGPGFEVLLPVDPAAHADQIVPASWVDDILTFQQDA